MEGYHVKCGAVDIDTARLDKGYRTSGPVPSPLIVELRVQSKASVAKMSSTAKGPTK